MPLKDDQMQRKGLDLPTEPHSKPQRDVMTLDLNNEVQYKQQFYNEHKSHVMHHVSSFNVFFFLFLSFLFVFYTFEDEEKYKPV